MGDVVYQIHVLTNLSTLYRFKGENGKAKEPAQQALLLCEQAGLALERRLPLGDLGAAEAALGNRHAARAYLEEGLEIARHIADRTQEIFCLGHLGWLDVASGKPASALLHLQEALAIGEQVDSRTEQSWLHSGLAEAYRLLDGRDPCQQALTHAQKALELAQTTGRVHDANLACSILNQLQPRDV